MKLMKRDAVLVRLVKVDDLIKGDWITLDPFANSVREIIAIRDFVTLDVPYTALTLYDRILEMPQQAEIWMEPRR